MSTHDSTADARAVPTAPTKMQIWFPAGVWIPKYQWSKNVGPDLIAAISVAALLIPESLGYASVAGLDGQIGLYAAILALVGYALFGGSKIMVFGAAGSVAAVTAGVLSSVGGGDSSKAATTAAILAMMTGIVFVVGGITRMGWVANFISKPVMAGLIFGMALQIIIGQLSKVFGIKSVDGSTVEKLWSYLGDVSDWNWTAVALGVGSFLMIRGLERYAPRVPGALTAVVVGSIIVAVFSPDIDLVDKIPQGLPDFVDLSGLDGLDWGTLIAGSVMVALVGFSEGWGASANIARKTHDQLDTNQEFRAYGVANFGSGVLGGMPTTGSLSKSAAAMEAGSKTQMSNIFLSVIVVLTLLLFAPLFEWLPEATLAAVVVTAMWGSAKPSELIDFWSISRINTCAGIITAVLVLTIDLMPALIVGMALSLLSLVHAVSFPTGAVLGRQPDTGNFSAAEVAVGERRGKLFEDAKPVPGFIIFRHSAPLIFANAAGFKGRLTTLLIEAGARNEMPHTMILDFEAVPYTDVTGVETLSSFIKYADRYNVDVVLARVHRDTAVLLERGGFDESDARMVDTITNAVAEAEARHGKGQGSDEAKSADTDSDRAD